MNNYEMVQLVHANQSTHVEELIKRQKSLIEESGGSVDRMEDWGRLRTAYSVKKNHKAHYILMNMTCSIDIMEKLRQAAYYNDIVMRFLIVRLDEAVTKPSCMSKKEKDDDDKERKTRIDIKEIDYKNAEQLSRFCSDDHKILPARITGVPRKFQRRVKKAIKRCRFLALVPYCDNHKI